MDSPFASTSDPNFSNSPFGNNSFEDQAPLSLNSEADVVDPLQALDQAGSTSSADAFFGTSQTETGSDHIFSPTNNDVTSEQPISEIGRASCRERVEHRMITGLTKKQRGI